MDLFEQLFVFLCICLFVYLYFFVLANNWNETQQSKVTCSHFLGSDKPGDHIRRQFTNPDVPKSKIHGSIGIRQDCRYYLRILGLFAPLYISAGKYCIRKCKSKSLLYFLQNRFHIEMYPEKNCILKVTNRTTRNWCKMCLS